MDDTCRCGHTGIEEKHPCHAQGYTCRQPAKRRFYSPRPVAIAGVMMKYEVQETWACDTCWAKREFGTDVMQSS